MNHLGLSLAAVSLTLATSQHCLLQRVTKSHADRGADHEKAAGNYSLTATSSVGKASFRTVFFQNGYESMRMRSGLAQTDGLASKISAVCSMTADFWQLILLAMALSLWHRFQRASKHTNDTESSPESTAEIGPGTETIRKPRNSRFHALSGFRLAVASIVICEHLGLLCPEIGGSIFVVLSGCVISVSRRASPGKLKSCAFSSPSNLMVFWIQRLARILPLYWFAILVVQPWTYTLGLGTISVPDLLISLPGEILANWKDLLMWNSLAKSHLWFVKTITMLYMCYPLIERGVFGTSGIAEQPRLWGFASLCVCYHIAMTLWAIQPQSQEWLLESFWEVYTNPVLRMPGFLLGMLVPHLQVAPVLNSLPYLADALFPILIYAGHTYSQELKPVLEVSGGVPFFGFIIWSLCFGECESLLGRLLKQPVAFTAGELSYGVYIYHVYFIVMAGCYGNSSCIDSGNTSSAALLLFVVTVLMASLILSQTTKILIEDPVVNCAKYFNQMCCHVAQ